MKELPKQETKQKEAYIYFIIHFHPLNYFDEAKLSKEVGRNSLSWGHTVALFVEKSELLEFCHPGLIQLQHL